MRVETDNTKVNYNLLKKVEKLEQIAQNQMQLIEYLDNRVKQLEK